MREARRRQGDLILTEHDLIEGRIPGDSVAVGSYHLDIREVQRTWRTVYEHPRAISMVTTEGYLAVPVPPYGLPYRALVPRREECGNLLVAVCISSSHVAFSSIRMEPQYQMLGHAAGVAAALAAESHVDVQDVETARLRALLTDQGAVLGV